uniref:KLF transcription factor 5 n=1 Tax=Hucho hucho TaxID=62062 RepID=A0A4W5RE20_9TELE
RPCSVNDNEATFFKSVCFLSLSPQAGKSELDEYLSPQTQLLMLPLDPPEQNKSRRDSASVMDHFFGDDQGGSPYSINMNVFLPDLAYLRMGLCRPARPGPGGNGGGMAGQQVKTEPPASSPFAHPHRPSSSVHGDSISLSMVTSHHGGSGPSPVMHTFHDLHLAAQAPYLPPSPPSSEPSSPDRQKDLLQNLSPPPSYAATIASKLGVSVSPSSGPALSLNQSMPIRYNRRTNPDLEKRRIHHCDFPGLIPPSGYTVS